MNFKFVAILIISSIAYANSQACTISQKSSCSTFIAFNFNILNDINEACQLYWVNFSGNLVFYKIQQAEQRSGLIHGKDIIGYSPVPVEKFINLQQEQHRLVLLAVQLKYLKFHTYNSNCEPRFFFNNLVFVFFLGFDI